jgi:hypothetical protein
MTCAMGRQRLKAMSGSQEGRNEREARVQSQLRDAILPRFMSDGGAGLVGVG